MIPIQVSFRYDGERNTVTTEVSMPPMPPFGLVQSLEEFYAFCQLTSAIVNGFITGLQEHLAKGEETEFKRELSAPDIDKLTKLKQEWEEKRGSHDEERA